MAFNYKFRSIMANNIEKNIPGTSMTRFILEFDENSGKPHEMSLGLGEIFVFRTCFINFFLAFLIIFAVAGLPFGLIQIAYLGGMNPAEASAFRVKYFSVSALILIITWIFFWFRNSLVIRKRELVEKERGNGNWKIIEEKKWDKFSRMLAISKKSKSH